MSECKKLIYDVKKDIMEKQISKGIVMGPPCVMCKIKEPLTIIFERMKCSRCGRFVCGGCGCVCKRCSADRAWKCGRCCPSYKM